MRNGSGAGIGQKPDDWNAVSLCRECHSRQHQVGEETFWKGRDVGLLVEAFCKASPKRLEIEQIKRERSQ